MERIKESELNKVFCPYCNGEGKKDNKLCKKCNGSGYLTLDTTNDTILTE